MPRRPRLPVTDLPLHVVQRGNDRRDCFVDDQDRREYLRALAEASAHFAVGVHAYVLMTNHVHLLVTPRVCGAVSRMMQSIGARYVRHFNDRWQRTGTLWEGRYKACLIASDNHVLAVCRYIDLNPVRAGMVVHPDAYRWSSYRALAGLRPSAFVEPHDALEQLGSASGTAYAEWCSRGIEESELAELRRATAEGLAFGNDNFRRAVERATAGPTFASPRGPKSGSAKSGSEP